MGWGEVREVSTVVIITLRKSCCIFYQMLASIVIVQVKVRERLEKYNVIQSLTRPQSSSRVTRTAGTGGDGKG